MYRHNLSTPDKSDVSRQKQIELLIIKDAINTLK